MQDRHRFLAFFESVNHRDLQGFRDLLMESAEFHFPKTKPLVGREQIVRFFNILFRKYPTLAAIALT